MVSKNEARHLIEDSHQELVLIVKLLKATIPDLFENRKIDELHTLLDMTISCFESELNDIEAALRHLYHHLSKNSL